LVEPQEDSVMKEASRILYKLQKAGLMPPSITKHYPKGSSENKHYPSGMLSNTWETDEEET